MPVVSLWRSIRPALSCSSSRARPKDWDANARVASVSPVPVMLDEPICELADVKRASAIANVGFCKAQLKRFGGLDLLREALDAVHEWEWKRCSATVCLRSLGVGWKPVSRASPFAMRASSTDF